MSDMLIRFAFAPVSNFTVTIVPSVCSGAVHLSSFMAFLSFSASFSQLITSTKNVSLRSVSSTMLTDLLWFVSFLFEKHCLAKCFSSWHFQHCFPNVGHCLGSCCEPQRLQVNIRSSVGCAVLPPCGQTQKHFIITQAAMFCRWRRLQVPGRRWRRSRIPDVVVVVVVVVLDEDTGNSLTSLWV